MLVVLDTNILVSAVLWSGRTTPILYLVKKGAVEFALNPSLIQELERVFGYPRFSKHLLAVGKSPREITEELIEMAIVVEDIDIPHTIVDDPSDDRVLACAAAANAEYIVSGDQHLLQLRQWNGMPIITARQFLSISP